MKFSKNFERDFDFYYKNVNNFTFSGKAINVDLNNFSNYLVMKAFHKYDSTGEITGCTHPILLKRLIQSKASCNWHIKQYAIDRAKGNLSKIELQEICNELQAPDWFFVAVESQKVKYL